MVDKKTSPRINITHFEDESVNDASLQDELLDYDNYGKTPPRTRILRKNKEKKSKEKETSSLKIKSKKPLTRRNSITTMFDDLINKADNSDSEGKRLDKRSLKLLRGSERDLKLDISSAQSYVTSDEHRTVTPQLSLQIEGCKRFKSLCSRRVTCSKKDASKINFNISNVDDLDDETECPQSRIEFHKTLDLLVRLGCLQEKNPKRHISREEHLWQNELKDLIWLELQAWHADRTILEQDSYICTARDSVGKLLNEILTYKFNRNIEGISVCLGCLSVYCQSCVDAQNKALRDIEELMKLLEAAESLFPSSKAFAEHYPLYNNPEFVGRVKAMCLWYNMTKHQRLKLIILGRLLALLENKYFQWPLCMCMENGLETSPSDSNSSSSSVNDCCNDKIAIHAVDPIALLVNENVENKTSPYRKYIENMLKTRGLAKSVHFLETLHKNVLRKSRITLEKPKDDSIFTQKIIEDNEEMELQRYGSWSPETKSLNLPSYSAAFLFLSAVPLEVIHEFLRMRIEQNPDNPSPLSMRQLMRELKEGIKIAILQRERTVLCIDTALATSGEHNSYKANIEAFDSSLNKVFQIYLDYLEQWTILHNHAFQKNLMEEEWNFCCSVVPHILESKDLIERKFCTILCTILNLIGERLEERIEEIALEVQPKDDCNRKQHLFAVCRELQALFNEEREMSVKTVTFAKLTFNNEIGADVLNELKKAVVTLKCRIPNAIDRVQMICDVSALEDLDELDKASLLMRYREILLQGFTFGFEFHKEMSKFVPTEGRERLARSMVQFANLWMKFVKERCERGKGKRPRWANQGLDFLLTVCEPRHTKYLVDEEFEELKSNMDACISHVIGANVPTTPDSGFHSASPRPSSDLSRTFPRSRGSSPSPRPTYKSQRSAGRKTSMERSPLGDSLDSPTFNRREETLHESLVKLKLQPTLHSERIRDAILHLESTIDERLREHELIGKVISITNDPMGKSHIRRRYVTFTWQRGIKIGQGRFGKVYTAVNNSTGEMMAMKEIALQHNDNLTIRRIAEELKILEGINHKSLVKYYGLEVHREEMLIFMEFCPEGTLETLVAATENGLPELLIRKYTYQLLSGIAVLHENGIVHRDIKSANIFLTDEGNYLKIGDFGCAVKIKSHSTMPGELQGFVGTQAYMAPEMFTKTILQGHGRAADIWSVGCVIVEMASGKRPWAEYDSNYQIMFKVGMGQRPMAPDSLTDEGHDFLDRCLIHNPKERESAAELLTHNFVKVEDDVN